RARDVVLAPEHLVVPRLRIGGAVRERASGGDRPYEQEPFEKRRRHGAHGGSGQRSSFCAWGGRRCAFMNIKLLSTDFLSRRATFSGASSPQVCRKDVA